MKWHNFVRLFFKSISNQKLIKKCMFVMIAHKTTSTLSGSKWGANSSNIETTALALCNSTTNHEIPFLFRFHMTSPILYTSLAASLIANQYKEWPSV